MFDLPRTQIGAKQNDALASLILGDGADALLEIVDRSWKTAGNSLGFGTVPQ